MLLRLHYLTLEKQLTTTKKRISNKKTVVMTKEQTNKVTELLLEAGVFFANTDGYFGLDEKEVIKQCVAEVRKTNDISDDFISVDDLSVVTFDELVEQMNDVLNFVRGNDDAKKEIIMVVEKFIETVIKADGKISPEEAKEFQRWKNIFNS